jgi:hypothetical protein
MKRKSGNGVTAGAQPASRGSAAAALIQDRIEKEWPFRAGCRHGIALRVEAGLLGGGIRGGARGERDVRLNDLRGRCRHGRGPRRRFERPGTAARGKRKRNRYRPGQGDGPTCEQQGSPDTLSTRYYHTIGAAILCRLGAGGGLCLGFEPFEPALGLDAHVFGRCTAVDDPAFDGIGRR